MFTAIDFVEYVRAPRINAATGVVLAIRLVRAAPGDLSPIELAALLTLRNAAKSVQDSVRARHRVKSSVLRQLDQEFDNAWGALHGRLVACSRLVKRPESKRASELLASLFPHGLRFLTSDYDGEWFHSRMLLDRMKEEGLYDEVVELAGEPYISEVEQAHAALGEVLELDENAKPEPTPGPGPNLRERILALSEAIGRYGLVLGASVNREDAASRNRFLSAVAPIDALRTRNRRAGVGGGAEEADEEQVGDGSELVEDELDVDSPIPPLAGE